MLSYVTLEVPYFSLNGIKLKIGAENKGWIDIVEYSRSIFDDLKLQLIARKKVKGLCKNL